MPLYSSIRFGLVYVIVSVSNCILSPFKYCSSAIWYASHMRVINCPFYANSNVKYLKLVIVMSNVCNVLSTVCQLYVKLVFIGASDQSYDI